MRVFIFYSALLENEKELQERQKLLEQLQTVDHRIEIRGGLLIGILKGIIETTKSNFSTSVQQKLITGGNELKYQGITIHKHSNCNTWYARYRFGGRQHYVSARTQQLCYDKLKQLLSKAKQKELKQIKIKEPEKTSMSFLSWYEKWKNLYKPNVKETTEKEYRICLKHLTELHHLPITKITAMQVLEQLNKIEKERAKQKTYELANALFQKAADNDIVAKNPMLVISKPKHQKINGNALSNADEKKLEDYLKQKGLDVFLVCLYQGLRRGEALALNIEDIDFENKTLIVNKSLNNFNEIDSTKNVHSVRIMPLFDKTLNLLEKYRNKTGRLFDMSQQACERAFAWCKKLFKTHYTVHSLRHTFITRCQESNIPLHIIQKWVGHVRGSSVTNAVYTHAREDAEAENIKILNKKLNSN